MRFTGETWHKKTPQISLVYAIYEKLSHRMRQNIPIYLGTKFEQRLTTYSEHCILTYKCFTEMFIHVLLWSTTDMSVTL